MTIAFDTLKLAERLEAVGMPSQQAKGVAAALAEALTGTVATAADLRESELRLRGEIRESESRLRDEIRESESRLRGEIREIESRLQGEVAGVRTETASVRTEISDLRAEILKRVIGAIGFQTVVILGAVVAPDPVTALRRALGWLDNGASLEDVQSAAGHQTLRPRNSMIAGGTILRSRRAFLRIIEPAARRCVHGCQKSRVRSGQETRIDISHRDTQTAPIRRVFCRACQKTKRFCLCFRGDMS